MNTTNLPRNCLVSNSTVPREHVPLRFYLQHDKEHNRLKIPVCTNFESDAACTFELELRKYQHWTFNEQQYPLCGVQLL